MMDRLEEQTEEKLPENGGGIEHQVWEEIFKDQPIRQNSAVDYEYCLLLMLCDGHSENKPNDELVELEIIDTESEDSDQQEVDELNLSEAVKAHVFNDTESEDSREQVMDELNLSEEEKADVLAVLNAMKGGDIEKVEELLSKYKDDYKAFYRIWEALDRLTDRTVDMAFSYDGKSKGVFVYMCPAARLVIWVSDPPIEVPLPEQLFIAA
jgi:hypothetical protein